MILSGLLISRLAPASDFESALARAQEAGVAHRYEEVIELLTPFNSADDPEARYITAAEIGRAYFHLGRYEKAHRAFREAVRLHPERVETAIYLEATSYLVGDVEQAYAILREILNSGARDLYLAVTLPGEKRFLADPRVQGMIEESSVTLEVDVESARMLGVALGDNREVVVETLEAQSSDPDAPNLTASAGPAPIWAFVFDDAQELREIGVQADNLVRYTPYRLHFGNGLTWRMTPAAAIAAWGPPRHTATSPDDGLTLTWEYPGHRLTCDFGRPRQPQPPGTADGAALMRTIRLTRQAEESLVRIDE
jgi:tetratricopeptide (TPR) repeat protein